MLKMIRNIARTELQMLFYSPIAWLILIVFTIQAGVLFSEQFSRMVSNQAMGYNISGSSLYIFAYPWGGVLTGIQGYLYYYIPLLTMSLVSRELSSGSIKLLYSSPVTNVQIIVGKFVSVMVYGAIMMGVLLVLWFLGLCTIKHFDWPAVLTGILGLYLLVCAYGAIGLFMSSLTSYQIVAAIGTFAVLMVLNMVGGWG
ncbi:MAG: ABC transporter permease subunit, partial [Marinifilaceae bacterium]|nr:ABC transporter permease subunit [Marinifilaceae bacterium]